MIFSFQVMTILTIRSQTRICQSIREPLLDRLVRIERAESRGVPNQGVCYATTGTNKKKKYHDVLHTPALPTFSKRIVQLPLPGIVVLQLVGRIYFVNVENCLT